MKPLQKKAILLKLVESLKAHESWCGETHIQKAAYCLDRLTKVPTDYQFILYKHGPFSFDLRDELTAMRADGLLDLRLNPAPFGPSLCITESGKEFIAKFPKTLAKHRRAIDFISGALGSKRVAELERLATALYVTLEEKIEAPEDSADRITALKPHISISQAKDAVHEVGELNLSWAC
jgi:hypothetical protein